jgi:GDP-L-fucose synthase
VRIYIAGIHGMVGSAIATEARLRGFEPIGKSSNELDLTDRKSVFDEIESSGADALIIAAAKVGGIAANSSKPVDFLSINLQIQTNLLDAAHASRIKKVIFLGSSCVYPKHAIQPISENALLTSPLEPTNEAYAVAKIAGIKLVEAYRQQFGHRWFSVMPTNMYGPMDNFELETSHVLPALINRFHNAKMSGAPFVELWGDGSPSREFLHVQDFSRACLLLLENYSEPSIINVGTGEEVTIEALSRIVSRIIGFKGDILFNLEFPNGTPRKLLDSKIIKDLGWKPRIGLEDGISETYNWFKSHHVKR